MNTPIAAMIAVLAMTSAAVAAPAGTRNPITLATFTTRRSPTRLLTCRPASREPSPSMPRPRSAKLSAMTCERASDERLPPLTSSLLSNPRSPASPTS